MPLDGSRPLHQLRSPIEVFDFGSLIGIEWTICKSKRTSAIKMPADTVSQHVAPKAIFNTLEINSFVLTDRTGRLLSGDF
jgi:hypothetical protein